MPSLYKLLPVHLNISLLGYNALLNVPGNLAVHVLQNCKLP